MLLRKELQTIIFFIFCASSSYANNEVFLDSLQVLLENTKDDSIKVSLIIQSIQEGDLTKESEILGFYSQGEKIAKNLKNPRSYQNLIYATGKQLGVLGLNEKRDEYFTKLAKLSKQDDYYKAVLNTEYGLIANDSGNKIKADSFYVLAFDLFGKIGRQKMMSSVLNKRAVIQRTNGNLTEAKNLLLQSLSLLTEEDESARSQAYSGLGRVYRQVGQNDSARINFTKALELDAKLGDEKQLAIAYNNLGNIEYVEGKFDKAMEYYVESLNIKEKSGNVRGACISYHNIAGIKFEMKNYDGALVDFHKSNVIAKDIDFKNLIIANDRRIGGVYQEKTMLDSAYHYYNSSFEISKAINFRKGIVAGHYNLGNYYRLVNDYQQSYTNFLKGLDLSREIKHIPYESAILVGISETFVASEENKLNKEFTPLESVGLTLKDVEKMLWKGYDLGVEMNNTDNISGALDGLKIFYTSTRNNDKLVDILNKQITLRDSVFMTERTDKIADLETKYETAEKEKEIVKLESENAIARLKTQRTRIISAGILLTFLLLTCFLFYLNRIRNKSIKAKETELFRSKLSSELHDDVGSLLTGLAMQSELLSNFVDGKTKDTVDRLASISREAMTKMRDTVWAIDSRKDNIADLKDRMMDFAEDNLMAKDIQLVFKDNMSSSNQSIKPEVRQNIYLIFKEAISNILKYSDATSVTTNLTVNRKEIELMVHDNGHVDESNIKTSGTGLSNMKMRAENLNGNFHYEVDQGFKIQVKIPA